MYNSLKAKNIKILDLTLEDLLGSYEYQKEQFSYLLSKYKNENFSKIAFITKYYNKELEKISIDCLQNQYKVLVLFETNITDNFNKFWKLIEENEKVLIIFSNRLEELKSKFKSLVSLDPIRDEIIEKDLIDNSDNNKSLEFNQSKIETPTLNSSDDINSNVDLNTMQIILSHNDFTEPPNINQTEKLTFANNEQNKIENIPTEETNTEEIKEINTEQANKEVFYQQPNEEIQQYNNTINNSTIKFTQKQNGNENKISEEPKETITKIKSSPNLLQDKEFKLSKLTIRVKLLSIIVSLIVVSLSLMIFLASFFFKRDIETRIQENNANLVQILAQKIEDLIQQIYFDSEVAIKSYQDRELANIENPYIISIGILKIEKENFQIEKWILNEGLVQQLGIPTDSFEKIILTNKDNIAISLAGILHIVNVSPIYKIPILMLIAPSKQYSGRIFVTLINAKKINDNFPSLTGGQTFMVNRNGEILASSNTEMAISSANTKEIPIVKMMLESKLDNGLTSFQYNNIDFLGAFKKITLSGIGIISITDANIAFEPVYSTQRRNIYILVIILIIAIIMIYFFSKTISQPINELAIATEYIEKEDYTIRVIPKTKDEIGLLSYSFNKMVKGLEERERMKDAFGRFVNKEIAEKALRGEIKLGGEKKICAVFFSDLRGFTAMSEKMKPEEVVEYLNRYFTLMVDCVEKTHGIVDKFIGDAVMATWGSVTSYGNDAENAINGALLMRKALIEFNKYNKEHNLPIAKFGCGINYGEVVSGQIGSEKRLEFTVIGDTVNLASRIEGLNKPFATDILISQDTYEKVKDIFDVVKMPAIKVKGKAEPQTIYCVLGRKDDPNRPKNLEELRKMVGIDWKPQIQEGQETLEDDKEEKFEILGNKEKK